MSFFLLEKRFLSYLDTSSIPPRHLAIYRASKLFFLSQSRQILNSWWIDKESSCLFDSFSTPGGLIELLFLIRYFCSLIPSWHLHLSTSIFSTPSSTDGSTPLDTSICRELLRIYIFVLCDLILISSISLDLSALVQSQTLSSHSNLVSQGFCKFFQDFRRWKASNLSFFMHFKFWNLSFEVFENFGVFQNWWVFVEILGWVKISCIALHMHYNCIFMHLDVCNLFVCW